MLAWWIWTTVIGLALVAIVAALPSLLARRGVAMTRTRFGVTLVFDSEDEDGTTVRLLNVNGTFQSLSYVDPDLRFELVAQYHRDMADVVLGLGRPVRACVLGGGGFSLPKYLATHEGTSSVDAVEIDPKIVRIARESFFLEEAERRVNALRPGTLNVVTEDAWAFLGRVTVPYDVIVNEAFTGKKPLGPMATDEGARVIKRCLRPGGVFLSDARCPIEGRGSAPLTEACEAFAAEFEHVAYLPERPEEPRKPGNNVLVATDADVRLPEGWVIVQ